MSPWLDIDIIVAQSVLKEAWKEHGEVRSNANKKEVSDATRSMVQMYVNKKEADYASTINIQNLWDIHLPPMQRFKCVLERLHHPHSVIRRPFSGKC